MRVEMKTWIRDLIHQIFIRGLGRNNQASQTKKRPMPGACFSKRVHFLNCLIRWISSGPCSLESTLGEINCSTARLLYLEWRVWGLPIEGRDTVQRQSCFLSDCALSYRIGQPPWYFHLPFFSISNVARILENPTWFCGLSVPSFSPAETLTSHEQKTMSFDLGIPRKRNIVSESALSI